MRDEVIHARIQSDVKSDAERILKAIGISMSQAIDLFLRQVTLKKGIPFELNAEEKEPTDIEALAYIINSTDGVEPSPQDKKIIHLYARGDIDLDTAKYALLKRYRQWKIFTSTKVKTGDYKTIRQYEVDKYEYTTHKYKD